MNEKKENMFYNIEKHFHGNKIMCIVASSTKTYIIMKTTINNFSFQFSGYGHYTVTYTSPATGKQWTKTISDMTLIDRTKNEDEPKQSDLDLLKKIVKSN